MGTKAYLDTSVYTDFLLKKSRRIILSEEFDKYANVALPAYAIKEFSKGPLQNYIYFYNLLATCTLSGVFDTLHRENLTPRKHKLSTVLEFLANEWKKNKINILSLQKKYGRAASDENLIKAQLMDSLNYLIRKAWRDRRKFFILDELNCFSEGEIVSRNFLLKLNAKCNNNICSAAEHLAKDIPLLIRIRAFLANKKIYSDTSTKRYLLKQIIHKRISNIDKSKCRSFGDLYFIVRSESDSDIITTNRKDFEPLVNYLKKSIKVIVYVD